MSIKNIISIIENSFKLFSMNYVQGIIEIFILTFIIYEIIILVKNTKAYVLLRGILVLVVLYLVTSFFDFKVIPAIMEKLGLAIGIAFIIIFQNELRYALEHIGRSNILSKIFPDVSKFTQKSNELSMQEVAKASFAMAKVKTGALIVIEQFDYLEKIEKTGIIINGKVSSSLLINIFEKNTPLHDGAVLIVGDIIKAATCYLPLTEELHFSKSYGTRHRAALGMSEVSDSKIVVVSEETGKVSYVYKGNIIQVNDEKELLSFLINEEVNNKIKNRKSLKSKIMKIFKYENNK